MSDSRFAPCPFGRLKAEPWVHLPDDQELKGWSEAERVGYNQANRQAAKHMFYVQAFDYLCENRILGDYHEYGCHRGRTFRMALTEARRQNLDSMNFHAFDSFEGLPEVQSATSVELWRKGALATSEEQFLELISQHGLYPERVRTVRGYYAESLTPALQATYLQGGRSIALACIDCDLYESALPVLSFLEPLLQEGSLLYLDDYYVGYRGSPTKGVAGAFREFRRQSRFQFESHLSIGWFGRSFIAYLD